MAQLNILEEGLINQPAVGFGESGRKASELRILLAKIEESEVCYTATWFTMFFIMFFANCNLPLEIPCPVDTFKVSCDHQGV